MVIKMLWREGCSGDVRPMMGGCVSMYGTFRPMLNSFPHTSQGGNSADTTRARINGRKKDFESTRLVGNDGKEEVTQDERWVEVWRRQGGR